MALLRRLTHAALLCATLVESLPRFHLQCARSVHCSRSFPTIRTLLNVTFRINWHNFFGIIWHISPSQKELYPGEPKRSAMNVCQISRKILCQITRKVTPKVSASPYGLCY